MSDWYKYLNIERDEHEDQLDMERVDAILFWGLAFIVLAIPLIVRVHIGDFISPSITEADILDTGKKADVFTYYKHILLLISTACLSLLFIYKVAVLRHSIPKTKINISLALLAIFITLSAVFAPYKTLALYGMYDRNEGTITYLCYLMLFFIAANIHYTEKRLKWALYCLYPFVMINTLLGIVNFYGYNVLELNWVKKLLYSNLPQGAKLTEGSRLIATINHGNYVSGISAVLTTLFFTWALLDKNKIRSIVNFVMSLLCFAMLLSSLSVSGFLTLTLILPIVFLFVFKSIYKRKFAVTFATFLVGAACVYVVMVNHNPKVWDETFGFFIKSNPFAEARAVVDELQQAFDASHVYAETGSNQENKEYQLPQLPESGVGPGSGRLYIWKKTWELIQYRPLFGYGLDTLPYFFPQDDPEKQANIETYTVIVDKPHNMYIGIAYGAGVIALLAFVAFIVNIGLLTIKRFISTKLVDDKQAIFASVAIACGAYLIQALFNDSIIGTAVIFWILLGLLVSFLIQNKQEKVS
ncbi:O-antigen ligase family protein [Geobacillus zalihae]|uniref:O-antigen ligase family protein n=1 Tax=Geobacillus zalihae TaxID=213419 RepID=UPI0026328371|nr:O-antigen ligase family protein [Geobacillus zalihae]WKA47198.1 O-antigen ligase family protein [Geobacillus zalihae]